MARIPKMDRKAFNDAISKAKSYAVWVQVNDAYQTLLPCSKEQAVQFAERGLDIMPVWGQLDTNSGCLELSLTSQWMDSLVPGFNSMGSYKKRMRGQVVSSMREYMSENSAPDMVKRGMMSGMLIFSARTNLITQSQYNRLQKVMNRWFDRKRHEKARASNFILRPKPGRQTLHSIP